ncbi:unnamed protein product [Porites lobata]|uniref:Uncharacterized protein n=1 Tax=Porites lobata TaxID=104759 RepID=A0ABN8SKM0_9CNID|nr:unnamed protein product [Porites lobata]CAH3165304.1 unnamed protein product [Porites lobata]CAH3180973.1 unnamed protein product [Porites lobata]CAH3190787.1 unnamed protein product [Porites lobata]
MLIVNLWHNTLQNLLLHEDQVLQGCLFLFVYMESHDKDCVDPKLKMKRGGYAEKESERYADD